MIQIPHEQRFLFISSSRSVSVFNFPELVSTTFVDCWRAYKSRDNKGHHNFKINNKTATHVFNTQS